VVVSGIEVDDGALPPDGAHKLVHLSLSVAFTVFKGSVDAKLTAIAIGALARAGTTDNELTKRHLGGFLRALINYLL
jgi:hypothetical protein